MADGSPATTTGQSAIQSPTRARLEAAFARQAALTPDAPAILCRGATTRYAELDAHANRIAHHLIAQRVGPGTLVGLCLERSVDMVAALIGILRTGAAYLPLDPAYPAARLDYMLADSSAAVLIGRAGTVGGLAYAGVRIDLDRDAAAIAAEPDTPPPPCGDGEALAYVMYTSGSTGQPKGVMLGHGGTGLVTWARGCFSAADMARMAATSSICFDPSILELFVPLSTGGLIVLKANALEPFTPDERPTMLNGPPSVLGELARAGMIPDSVRVLNVGGEPVANAQVRALYAASKVERVYNHYGPTEATTLATVAPLPRDATGTPTIGRAIPGVRIHILDIRGLPAATGMEGDIHIAGDGVAIGYLGNPALTAERFLPDPFTPGGRMFRTGDLGRWTADGEIEFLGRADTQVKLRGFRIELGEVESALLRVPGIRAAAAAVVRDAAGRGRLAAYVVADKDPGLAAVQRRLATGLPHYMVPSHLVVLDALPLTATGKLDRGALPDAEPPNAADQPDIHGISPVEEVILNAYRLGLDRPDIGLDDEFFAAGGDSLLAIEVAMEIEQLLGQVVPVAMLGHDTTPRSLAAMLEDMPVDLPEPFVTLQPKGRELALFCLHDLYGRALSHVSLARRLAPNRPVHGLLPGPIHDALIAKPDMTMLVQAHVATIRALQPHGPYLVSGFSFCGPFAHAIACALEAEGETVLLILIDTSRSRRLPTPRYLWRWAKRWGRTASLAAISSGRTIWLRWFLPRLPIRMGEIPGFVPRCDHAIARAIMQARVDWTPGLFHGPTLVIRSGVATPMMDFVDQDGLLGWASVVDGPVTQVAIEGTHNDMMREPLVADVAEVIRIEAAKLKTA